MKMGNAEEKGFQECKLLLNKSNLLVHGSPKKPIIVACDASPCGVGAVLSHLMPDRSEKPIIFASRTLSKSHEELFPNWKRGISNNICPEKVSLIYLRKTLYDSNWP